MVINYTDLFSENTLFLDFIYNFNNVKRFYYLNFNDKNDYAKVFENITSAKKTIRKELTKIINNQYSQYSPSTKTINNIKKLTESNTIAVLTNINFELFGGKLSNFYKILTSIKLCQHLSSEYPGYNFVPVLWINENTLTQGKKHKVKFIDTENELKEIVFDNFHFTDKDGKDYFKFKSSVNSLLSQIKESIRETELSKEFFSMLNKIFDRNVSLTDSFFIFLFNLFDKYGLIIFNSMKREVKKTLIPVFQKELNNYQKHSADILTVSADLDDNYHSQEKVKPLNLLYTFEKEKYFIEPFNTGFRIKETKRYYEKETLLNLIETEPENFSADTLLRPVCQSYLFNNGFYIGNVNEINFMAQVLPLYKHFDIQQPIVFPQLTATIVESNIAKILLQFNLSIKDFFSNNYLPENFVTDTFSPNDINAIFDSTEEMLINNLTGLSEKLSLIDIELGNESGKLTEDVTKKIFSLRQKALTNKKNKMNIALKQLKKTENILFPNNNLQEQELSIFYFMNKYGNNFFDLIFNEIDIAEFEHQILEL